MNKYKIWLKKGNERMFINYESEKPPALLHYHLRNFAPRIQVANAIYNVNAYDTFWIEEVK